MQGAFESDAGRGDITTQALFPHACSVQAFIKSREAGIFAGRQEVESFLKGKLRAKFFRRDGEKIRKDERLLELTGDILKILALERTILNFLGRMSGVASGVMRMVKKARRMNPLIEVSCIRKTLLGLLDKRACMLGGGDTHRLNLSDAILIKDNHLDALGRNIEEALTRANQKIPSHAKFLEIEVENSDEALRACRVFKKLKLCLPCFVMFDNFSPAQIRSALQKISAANLKNAVTGFEASGGITEKNIAAFAKTGVDIISMGSLTASAKMMDLTLEIRGPDDI